MHPTQSCTSADLVALLTTASAEPSDGKELAGRAIEATKRLAAPKSVREVGFGMLVVRTEPTGASVSVDGREVGPSPITVERLAAGTHLLEATTGELKAVQTIQIPRGGVVRKSLNLEGAPVRVVVVTTPPEARVFVDGKEVGLSPVILPTVPTGHRVFRAAASGHRAATRSIKVVAPERGQGEGEVFRVELVLEPNQVDVLNCLAGEPLTTCSSIATESWENGDEGIALSLWKKMCAKGNGNVCAYLASREVDAFPKRASARALKGCDAGYEPACSLFLAIELDDKDALSQAKRLIEKDVSAFQRASSPSYAYNIMKDRECSTEDECKVFCDAGVSESCVEQARLSYKRIFKSADAQTASVAELDLLKTRCAEGHESVCREFEARRDAYNAKHAGTPPGMLAASLLLGFFPLVVMTVPTYVGVVAGILAMVSTQNAGATAIASAMVGGAIAGALIGAVSLFFINYAFTTGTRALLLTVVSFVSGVLVAGAAAATAWQLGVVGGNPQLNQISAFLLVAAPLLGAAGAATFTSIAAPFIINDEAYNSYE